MKDLNLDNFKNVSNINDEYSLVPFWFWNDDLKEENLLRQLNEMHNKHIRQFIIHSRKGLQVEYLSDTWFEKVEFTLKNAQKLGMTAWIYDEDNWPSGYAGGKVLKENPDFCGKNIKRYGLNDEVPVNAKEIKRDDKYRYMICDTLWHPAYSDDYYTDLLNADATDCFIKHTHAEYYKRLPQYFKNGVIRGFFVDEPGFYNNFNFYEIRSDIDSVVYTAELPEFFMKEKGYDIVDNLAKLWDVDKQSLQIRRDFFDVVTKMYVKNFFQKIADYCHSVGVKLIGHEHSEECLPYHLTTQGDLMRAIGAQDYAGVDRIDLTPRKVTEKYGSSTAHMFNKSRTMSETFAASGLDLNPERIKEWTNYQYVRGINMLTLHAFFASTEGDRKWECPPSLFYQNFYWKYFDKIADYGARLSYLLANGTYGGCALLYYPITTVLEKLELSDFSKASQYDRMFVDIAEKLLEHQMDYDFLHDDALVKAEIKDKKLWINGIGYSFIILPDITNIPKASLKVISEFAKQEGGVIYIGKCEFTCVDGDNDKIEEYKQTIVNSKNFMHINQFRQNMDYSYEFDGAKVLNYAKEHNYCDLIVRGSDSDIKYQKRYYDGKIVYFVVNESNAVKNVRFTIKEQNHVYGMNAYDGSIYHLDSIKRKNGTEIITIMQPHGECIVLASDDVITNLVEYNPLLNFKNIREDAVIDDFNIKADGWEYNGKIDYWSNYGHQYYSGKATYTKNITIDKESNRRYFIDMEDVHETVEVYCNDEYVDTLIWKPYTVEITKQIRTGNNTLKLVVANTTANKVYNQDFDSGVVGAIKIKSGEI